MVLIIIALIFISVVDIRKRQILNSHICILALVVILHCVNRGAANQICYFLPVLIVGIALWKLGYWGAGDAKLLATLAPAIHPEFYPLILAVILIIGGVLALVISKILNGIFKLDVVNSIPYAVPISIGSSLGILASLG